MNTEEEKVSEISSNDRFGVTERQVEAAIESHGKNNPAYRMGMYVPTRQEVATMPIDELSILLDLWMWESPSELIPSRAQIAEVRRVVAERPDASTPEGLALLTDCDRYIHD